MASAAHRRAEYGRRRAARRVDGGRFAVHPGWRGRIPHGLVVVTDQPAARELIDRAVDAEGWRSDRRHIAVTVLQTLADAMDWRTGLVTGATREKAAQRAGASLRTVSRVLAWASRVGLLVCVEKGATGAFLGTRSNRAPAYVFVSPSGMPIPRPRRVADDQRVDEIGNPPASCVSTQTLVREGVKRASPKRTAWPGRDRARDGRERAAATQTVLDRAGVRRVPAWKASAMLARWWRSGWSVSGVLYAIDHHPDRPGESRGDAIRGARDPLAVIGHRLAAWAGREHELPAVVQAVDPDERRRRAARLAEQLDEPAQQPPCAVATAAGRQQARELFAAAQRARRAAA
ncbi:MAG: hypothetical protein ACQEXM_27340 [Actinomycetota bacterium]